MTDHKKNAENALEVAMNTPDKSDGTNPEAVTAALVAQASATLYLAEQQRIANFIQFAICYADPDEYAAIGADIRRELAL